MTAAAFDNAGLLRRLARQDAEPIASQAALAAELKRDPANLRKTFKILEADGVVAPIPGGLPTLTALGHQTLHGIDVAQGLTTPGPEDRWPLDRIRPNPANRKVDPDGIIDMALSVVAVGDVYTPVTLTPIDDDGFRMLLAGERRWRGALKALNENDLSDRPIAEGLMFVEREATEAEALQLMIIENTQREGLSPLEDARQLSRLQQLTGLNGVDLAIHVGRCDRQNKNGAKDVQEKLKIIREATPEAIADYEARGSWDDLRNSVRTKREAADASDDAEGRIARPFATYTLPNARRPSESPLLRIEIGQHEDGTWSFATAAHTSDGMGGGYGLSSIGARRRAIQDRRLALIQAINELRAKSVDRQVPIEEVRKRTQWLDRVLSEHQAPDGAVPAPPSPHVVNGVDYLNASRAQEARYANGIDPRPAANYSGVAAAPTAGPSTFELSPRARLALIELAHKVHAQRQPLDPATDSAWSGDVDQDYAAFGAFVGTYWLETTFSDLQSERLVRAVHLKDGVPPMAALTPKGVRFLIDQAVPLPPLMATLRNAHGDLGIDVLDVYLTGWLDKEAKPAAEAGARQIVYRPAADLTQAEIDDGFARSAALIRKVAEEKAAHPEQPDLIEPRAEEIEARRRSAEETEQAGLAERSVLHFGGVILGWAKDRRDAGAADHISLPSRSPRAGNYDEMAQQALGALADGRFAEAAALLSALQTHVGEDGAGRLLRQMPLPVIQRALMEGRIHPPAIDEDDDSEPWAPDPDPSDDAAVPDGELEHVESETTAEAQGAADIRTPAVPIRKSIHPDYIICLEDGRKFKSLKRHLRTKYDLSPEEYIARWGLPRDYPMVAPNYAKTRADLAARIGASA